MTTTIDQPASVLPVAGRVVLAHAVRKAKVASERADADAAQALSDAQTARHHYESLKTELDALKETK